MSKEKRWLWPIGPNPKEVVLASAYDILRDERDRLSAALLNVRVAWNNRNETTSLRVWHERMKAAMADVEAAMTPAGQRRTPNEATE